MTMLDAALALVQQLPVFPCKVADKTPYTTHGFKDASTRCRMHTALVVALARRAYRRANRHQVRRR